MRPEAERAKNSADAEDGRRFFGEGRVGACDGQEGVRVRVGEARGPVGRGEGGFARVGGGEGGGGEAEREQAEGSVEGGVGGEGAGVGVMGDAEDLVGGRWRWHGGAVEKVVVGGEEVSDSYLMS